MDLLTRLVLALEAIAKALNHTPDVPKQPQQSANGAERQQPERRQSTVADISLVSPIVIERARAASVDFFIDNKKVPWSEAAMKGLIDFEAEFERVNGPGSSENLPWRSVVPRGEEIKNQ